MGIYNNEVLTFKEPTAAEVALSPSLVSVIRNHNAKTREHLFHLCMIAYGLRKHNLMKKKSGAGGNASGLVMKPQFWSWYKANDLFEIYGSESNFILYAMSGRLLSYVRWQIGEIYVSHLPKSLTALHQCSRILWKNGDATDRPRRRLFLDALKTPIRDGSKHNALITPQVSRNEVKRWIDAKTGVKRAFEINEATSTIDLNVNVDVLTIRVHDDIYKFAKTGRKIGIVDLPDLEILLQQINDLIKKNDKSSSRFQVVSNLETIRKTYEEKKFPDFAANI